MYFQVFSFCMVYIHLFYLKVYSSDRMFYLHMFRVCLCLCVCGFFCIAINDCAHIFHYIVFVYLFTTHCLHRFIQRVVLFVYRQTTKRCLVNGCRVHA